MREWIPVPGSVKARIIAAAVAQFEQQGFEAAGVGDIARQAGVTTGALYHHFGSKLGLFRVIREEMERRVRDRMEGAHAAVGGGWPGLAAALLVGFDAAVHFSVARILSDAAAPTDQDLLKQTLKALSGDAPASVPEILLGTYRATLASVASGSKPEQARLALKWLLRGKLAPPPGLPAVLAEQAPPRPAASAQPAAW